MASDAVDELNTLGVTEVLDQDSRPTFVIDLDPDEEGMLASAINPVFCNASLRSHETLFDAVRGKDHLDPASAEAGDFVNFRAWATGVTQHDDSKDVFPLSFTYRNLLWTGSTVRKRWRLISGNLLWNAGAAPVGDLSSGTPPEVSTGGIRAEKAASRAESSSATAAAAATAAVTAAGKVAATAQTEAGSSRAGGTTLAEMPKEERARMAYQGTAGGSSSDTGQSGQSKNSIILSVPEKAVADWTAPKPKGMMSEHIRFARSIKWEETALGPMEGWSREFRQVVNLVMNNPHPVSLTWGSELTMLYNEAYAKEVAGNKHPNLMGTGFSGPFSELWDGVAALFAECARTGVSIRKDNDYLPIERYGILEETFFSWSWIPLYGNSDKIMGFYNAPFETTQEMLYQRRNQLIGALGEETAHAKTVKDFWKAVISALESNENDVPFALLYSVGDNEDADHSSISSGSTISLKSCFLEGALGIPEGHIAAPLQLDLKRSREGFIPAFREAMRTREPTLLNARDGSLPEALLEGIQWRGYGDPCKQAIIFPVRPTNGDLVMAFLLLGVSPRRPYDDQYRKFVHILNRQLATSLDSLILYEEEVRRSRDAAEAAALEQERLTQQLALQSSRLRRMTELSPLGMFLISPEGVLREGNDRFFEMTGLRRNGHSEMSWMECIMEGSMKVMNEGWDRLVRDHVPWADEVQLHKWATKPLNLEGEEIDYWVMMTAQPEFASDSSLRSIMVSITDISHLKWAQGLQNRRLLEAEETRRQQNEFIDITSHEMRNPLSAILQCADDIISLLAEANVRKIPPNQEAVDGCVEAANTIALCVQHQKSIVDDILTISKLDSNLLHITPVPSQPISVTQRALRIFDPELQANDITVSFDVHPSVEEHGINWVNFDPSRISQILINLMTNAIKFTTTSSKRLITVSVGAGIEPPLMVKEKDFQYIPAKTYNPNFVDGADWGSGTVVYLRFKVQDTGCGLTKEEKQKLFERFSQASPRTHAQYGGSGLGLFISRQLAELHGGRIGVASEAGVGSTFGFFVIGRKTEPPIDAQSRPHALSIHDELGSADGLAQKVAPQRQDFATTQTGPAASLLASRAVSQVFDPQTIDILVVEDNLINQKVLVQQLRKQHFRVAVANDGIEALTFLEQTHFMKGPEEGIGLSLILMDLEMPNMDGLTCVKEIRKMEAAGKVAGHVPVIAVTANVRPEQVNKAKMAGMDDVVSKPFRMIDLYKQIEGLLASLGEGGGREESAVVT